MRNLLLALGFTPKENTQDIYAKRYPLCGGYELSVDYKNEKIEYGDKIGGWRSTTANFSQDENWVVLECVDRLLSKWYRPEDIILEKKFTVGHGAAGGWLDIFVKREWKAYLMIECKTWGKEFDKEWQNTQKKWWQLLSYLQQDRDTEFLILYASQFENGKVIYKNEIIKVEEDYRQMASNTEDLYNRWNKFSKQNGIFESWARAYHFESKALTLSDLSDIRQEDSSFIFNRFLEILRHNAVSDKPNAFNKIFTLFLCKIKDEDKNSDEELDFQWKEWEDDPISFQKRLSDLYRIGMNDFLKKEITDISDQDFNAKYGHISTKDRENILIEITKLRLQKNNEFAIKEVFDEETFYDNAKVLKEVVELLQTFRFRYAKKQPFLGDFFELLLTTGLKQEAGQFFTPVPIARFISKSVPLEAITKKKLAVGATDELLPNIIDYAAGSGHFLTESMEELQNIISRLDLTGLPPSASRKVKPWQHDDPFAWAHDYIYGIELDYRLVKTTKVGCYLHGDGIANVIHGDGLDSFTDGNYLGKLQKKIPWTQDNGQFDFVLANPPYSVSACKGNLKNKNADKDFDLYRYLTDQSSQIESLFIERTKQLLTEWGIAAIILPSSILSNGGIYTRTREILLRYFEFVAITELGSGTFMATGTNTVILFLRRRSNTDFSSIESSIANFFTNHRDISIKTNFSKNTVVENAISKYITHVWWDISFDDYLSLISGEMTEKIASHEITREYDKKLKSKDRKDWLNQVKDIEKGKILYFLLTYEQEIVLVKSGDKQDEKNFLGYEFSARKWDEGIHPLRRGKLIDECTLLYHPEEIVHPERINTYILDAYAGKYNRTIPENISKYITRANLVDMLTWDRAEFEKNISLSVKKKIKIESKWEKVSIKNIAKVVNGFAFESSKYQENWTRVIRITNVQKWAIIDDDPKFHPKEDWLEQFEVKTEDLLMSLTGNVWRVWLFPEKLLPAYLNQRVVNIIPNDKINKKYLFYLLNTDTCEQIIWDAASGLAQKNLSTEWLKDFQIPLPPLDIQEQIVREIEGVEKREKEIKERIESWKQSITGLFQSNQRVHLKSFLQDINPSKSAFISWLADDTEVAFLSMPDVSNDGMITNLQTRPLKDVKSWFTFFQENDVLLAKITPCMENGKGALVPGIVNNLGFWSTEFFVLRPDLTKIQPKILFYFIQDSVFRIEAEKSMTWASGHRRVPKEFVENYQVPDISLPEQSRIVAEIEQIEAEIASLEFELGQIPAEQESILKKYL